MKPIAIALALIAALAGSAHAAWVTIPAAAFVTATFDGDGAVIVESGTNSHRAPVYFPVGSQDVCMLSFWVHDNDPANSVTVRLLRKRLAPRPDPYGADPQVVAETSSTGAVDELREFETTNIVLPRVGSGYAYWVDLQFSGGPIAVAGVRIFTAPTCPVE